MPQGGPDTVVALRPVGTPLPLGFIGLFVATSLFSSLQLGWLPTDQSHVVAVCVLALTVPVQLIACLYGFLARDPVAGTGMGLLAGTWAGAGVVTLTSSPGRTVPALGVLLLVSGAAMLVPAAAAVSKLVPAAVMATSALRFLVTGVAEVSGSQAWLTAAGWVGVGLAVLALYAALALELEGVRHRTVLPLLRRGTAETAVSGDFDDEVVDVSREPGVRSQL